MFARKKTRSKDKRFEKNNKPAANKELSADRLSSIIGNETRIEGTIITKASLRIEGTVIGGIISDGSVILTDKSQVKGNIIAESVIVAGRIDGNIQAAGKVQIESGACLYGDISSGELILEDGVIWDKTNN